MMSSNISCFGRLFLGLILSGILLVLSACSDEQPVAAPQQLAPVPAAVMQKLHRGVNLSNWFTFRDTAARWGSHIPELSDFPVIYDAGFRHVRIGFDPLWLADMTQPEQLRVQRLASLEQALVDVSEAGLMPILVAQPEAPLKKELLYKPAVFQDYLRLWEALARRFVGWPAESIVFEPLNEPEMEDAVAWAEMQKTLLSRLRTVVPNHTLLATGHGFANVADMVQLKPVQLDNIAYSFHFYAPHNFTHQGARWGWPMWRRFHSWPYPSSPELVKAPLEKQDEDAKEHLEWYGEQRWNRAKLAEILDRAKQWANKHNVQVVCTEFGVYKFNVTDDYRHTWLRDARELLEERGFGWTVWDYAGGFGIVEGPPGKRYMQAGTRASLGLPARR